MSQNTFLIRFDNQNTTQDSSGDIIEELSPLFSRCHEQGGKALHGPKYLKNFRAFGVKYRKCHGQEGKALQYPLIAMLENIWFEPAGSWQHIERTSRRILFVFSIFVTDRAFVEPWHRNGNEIYGNVTALSFVITWKMCLWILALSANCGIYPYMMAVPCSKQG